MTLVFIVSYACVNLAIEFLIQKKILKIGPDLEKRKLFRIQLFCGALVLLGFSISLLSGGFYYKKTDPTVSESYFSSIILLLFTALSINIQAQICGKSPGSEEIKELDSQSKKLARFGMLIFIVGILTVAYFWLQFFVLN